MKSACLVLGCGLLGGIVGHLAFGWLLTQGYYGMVLPGGLVGMAAGLPRGESRIVPVICGLAALLLGLFTEWRFFPFKMDGSFAFFLRHLDELKPVTWMMIGIGALMAWYVPFRRVDGLSSEPST
ncbi:MAG: hypothetical protein ACKONH_09570 [Planctomycetia bacterium]|jgi:hypothetical protein